MRKYSLDDKIIIIVTALLFASFFVFRETAGSSLVVLLLTIVLFFFYLKKNKWVFYFKFCDFFISILLFALYCFFSALWSVNHLDAIENGITIIKILVTIAVVYWSHRQFNSIEPIVVSLIFGGYIVSIYYIFSYGGLNDVISNAIKGERDVVDFANINSIGRMMAIVIVANIFMLIHSKNKKLYIGIILPIITLFSTESRMAFIELIVGVVVLMFLNSIRNGNPIRFTLKLILYATIIYIMFKFLENISVFQGLSSRLIVLDNFLSGKGKVDGSLLLREQMIKLGWSIFKSHPLAGVGMGNAHIFTSMYLNHNTYLHNGFVEILAGGGILGFVVYYVIFIRFIIRLCKVRFKDVFVMLSITILIMALVSDLGGVSYYVKETYFYLIMCYICIEYNINTASDSIKERIS